MNKYYTITKKCNYDVLDIYLFINPLDINCVPCIDEFTNYTTMWQHKIYIHIIPYCNLKTVHNYLKNNNLDVTNLALHNNIYNLIYEISLLFKAISCQGKKKAFEFLQRLTQIKQAQRHELTTADLNEIIQQCHLDLNAILSECHNEHTRSCYMQDLKIANQFKVQKTPSVVIFDSYDNEGILLNNIEIEQLIPIINTTLLYKYKTETSQ